MRCIAITKGQKRCANFGRLPLCAKHKKHPIVMLVGTLTFLGVLAGIYRDVIEPLLPKQALAEKAVEIPEISIPIEIESSWDYDTGLNRTAEYYLLRPVTPVQDEIVSSGVARVEVPSDGGITNGKIWIPANGKVKTKVILPQSKMLEDAYKTGGYEIQVVLKNEFASSFEHSHKAIFDKDISHTPLRFWFRLVSEEVVSE